MLLNSSNTSQQMLGHNTMTTINIENDITPGTSQHLQRQQNLGQIRREVDSTRINMETNANQQAANGLENQNIDDRQRSPNLFAMFREARHQFNRSQSVRDNRAYPNGANANANTRSRTWRENLYEVLSSPASPHAQTRVLRAIFTPSSNLRYDNLNTNVLFPGDQFHFSLNHQNISQTEGELHPSSRSQQSNGLEPHSSSNLRLSRQSSRLTEDISLNENLPSDPQTPVDISLDNNATVNESSIRQSMSSSNSSGNSGHQPQRQISVSSNTTAPTVEAIDDVDPNAIGEIIFKIVTHFIRYLPFIFIVFVKFIHDHLLAILDIFLLQGVVYLLNKSIKEQVAKLNQKILAVLVRDLVLVVCVIMYRFILSTSTQDPFGLLINPPGTIISLDLLSTQGTYPNKDVSSNVPISLLENESPATLNSTISITKTMSLGTLLYYVAVNDLVLKLITQLIKIVVTMFPTKVIRHKSRARLYALIENISQFYRALVPIRQWLRFLYESYTGFEVISGILFSSFYVGAKLFELYERGRPLKNTIANFMRNMHDSDRKPTNDELEAAGTVCPICHDPYSSPVVLECGHIFCDDCVNTWFKREQTCPMCRAKVSEDPAWQNGATTYFYQLF